MSGGRLPAPLLAYRALATALSLAAPFWLRARARRGREDPERVGERYGRPGRDRPAGDIAWAHGASIGECLSLLPVVEVLVARGLKVVVTSGTRTAAEIVARRAPPGARHQYLPLDAPRFVSRFLDHWQPCLALFAESEIWPNAVLELDRRGTPLVLVNGRLSARSFDGWRRAPATARAVFGRIALAVPQSEADGARLAALGTPVAPPSGNLKFDLRPPPADPALVEELGARLAGRTLWMAASTHPGEEAAAIEAHRLMRERHPGLLTILAPRHPGRSTEIAATARMAGLDLAQRSAGTRPDEAAGLFLVDTVGELGLFYRLAPLVFMGGSLAPHGGQNPFEPARLAAAILHGPHVDNFEEIYRALDEAGGALPVGDAAELAAAASDLLADPALIRDMARAGGAAAASLGGARDRTLAAITPFLPPAGEPGDAVW